MTAPASPRLNTGAHSHEQIDPLRRLQHILWGVAVLCGFLEFWATRYVMFSDGTSYLDIAGLYAQGAWKSAASEYWSPMFSWLIAAALYMIRPAGRFEAVLVHAICLAGYLAALAAFGYFLRQLTGVLDLLYAPFPEQVTLRRALLIVAYAAFIWATLPLIGLCDPDVLVTGFVYLISGMLLRSARQGIGLAFCAAFGALIGLGWLTKAALLPIGLATLPAFAILVRKWRRPLIPLLLTVAALAAVSFPFLIVIREAKGYWSFGKSGLLNYSWEVNGVTRYYHWQGGPGEFGWPLHPTRQIAGSPPVYEFRTSWPVTYPPWFDPAHWYQGIRTSFDAGRQARAFGTNLSIALLLLLFTPGILPAVLVWCAGRGKSPRLGGWWKMSVGVWVWCGTTIVLYSLVFVEPRYIGGTLAVVSCLLLAPLLSKPLPLLVLRIRWFIALSVLPCLYACWRPMFLGAALLLFNIMGVELYPNADWREAQYLQSIGVRPGDAVGFIGDAFNAYWPRLIQARIIAEIPVWTDKQFGAEHAPRLLYTDVNAFWSASPERQREILSVFAGTGVRWLVAEPVPPWVKAGDGWTELPFTRKGEKEYNGITRTFIRRLNP